MYAFLDPVSGKVEAYDTFSDALLQAVFAGQEYLCCFDGEKPYLVETKIAFKEEYQ